MKLEEVRLLQRGTAVRVARRNRVYVGYFGRLAESGRTHYIYIKFPYGHNTHYAYFKARDVFVIPDVTEFKKLT
jgi:hypothetical protein